MMRKRTMLPKPDGFGHYWFGDKPHGIAIFCSAVKPGKFFASLGGEVGILMNDKIDAVPGQWVKYFDTPEEALIAIRRTGALP